MSFKKVLLSVSLIVVLIVILQNTEAVTVRFLFWKLSMSRVFLYPLLFLTGLFAGYLWGRLKSLNG